MVLTLLEKVKNKTFLVYACAGVAVLLFIGSVAVLVNTMIKKPEEETARPLQGVEVLETNYAKVKQTLEQEKSDRAKVKEALEAPGKYQKLAQ